MTTTASDVTTRAQAVADAEAAFETAAPGWDRQLASAALRRAREAHARSVAALRTARP